MSSVGEFIAFTILAMMGISGAVLTIHLTRVVHMALSLAFTFFSIAGIYLLLNAQFLAVVQILIYTGAVSILMLFGVMLTKHHDEERASIGRWHAFVSLAAVAVFFAILMCVIYQTPFVNPNHGGPSFSVTELGEKVFTQYVIPFELTSILLLVALVGAIVLAKREEE